MSAGNDKADRIFLKPSPLVSLLSYLYSKYPALDCDAIDAIVMESKCNSSSAEELIALRLVKASSIDKVDSGSLNDWYAEDEPTVDNTRPNAEIKVYRLEGGDPFSSSP